MITFNVIENDLREYSNELGWIVVEEEAGERPRPIGYFASEGPAYMVANALNQTEDDGGFGA